MRSKANSSQRGQVLVITAGAMIVVLGIAALVIDIGLGWMLRRHEQNAADPAAIAAARHLMDSSGTPVLYPLPLAVRNAMRADACFYAQQNGFFAGDDAQCTAAGSDLRVLSPPTSGRFSGQQYHVQVIITSRFPSLFGRIFGASEQTVATAGTAANLVGSANSNSLVALKTECTAGASGEVSGGGEVLIKPATGVTAPGGYVYVNSKCGSSSAISDDICENGSGSSGLHISGELTTPYANTVGSCSYSGSPPNGLMCYPSTATACLDEGAVPLADPLADTPEPPLSLLPYGTCPNGVPLTATSTGCFLRATGPNKCPVDDPANPGGVICRLGPGVYPGGFDVGGKVRLELQPGMYILAGGGIKQASDAEITAVIGAGGIDARIMIFSTDGPNCATISAQCQGDINVTAQGAFSAKSVNTTTCQAIVAAGGANICPWRGILLWQDGTASNPTKPVKLGGQAALQLAGTIYAPKAAVDIAGGSSTTGCQDLDGDGQPDGICLALQIISWTWKITGGGLLEMPYDPSEIYPIIRRGLVD